MEGRGAGAVAADALLGRTDDTKNGLFRIIAVPDLDYTWGQSAEAFPERRPPPRQIPTMRVQGACEKEATSMHAWMVLSMRIALCFCSFLGSPPSIPLAAPPTEGRGADAE